MHKEELEFKTQIVVPLTFRDYILKLAHQGLAGHSGVWKTYDRIRQQFYWPKVKRDVAKYIRSCHTCQITSKPNQKSASCSVTAYSCGFQPF